MQKQTGGVFLGLIIGLVIGLGIALSVAIYVTKVPVPFVNKGQSRSADQDEAEARKNKNWDPNAPLYGKNPAKAVPPASVPELPPKEAVTASVSPSGKTNAKPDTAAEPKTSVKLPPSPAMSADPLGDLVKSKTEPSSAKSEPVASDSFTYFIQLGAFDKAEAAESRRAELSLSGVDAKVSAREQSGKTIYRVRVGPFETLEDSNRGKEKLEKSGVKETALVRIRK
jgi:cell division protein FtsN